MYVSVDTMFQVIRLVGELEILCLRLIEPRHSTDCENNPELARVHQKPLKLEVHQTQCLKHVKKVNCLVT